MTSIFSLRCAQCDGELVPAWGAIWTCAECDATFEVCGRYLVPVVAERESPESARAEFTGAEYREAPAHAPVDADGTANTREGRVVTGQGSATRSS
jgi:hypothetical protein